MAPLTCSVFLGQGRGFSSATTDERLILERVQPPFQTPVFLQTVASLPTIEFLYENKQENDPWRGEGSLQENWGLERGGCWSTRVICKIRMGKTAESEKLLRQSLQAAEEARSHPHVSEQPQATPCESKPLAETEGVQNPIVL